MNNYDTRALADANGSYLWNQFGEVLRLVDSNNVDLNYLTKILKRPNSIPRYRLFVLNVDETVSYEIPQEDIIINSGSFTENYQNGQRKAVNINLVNIKNKGFELNLFELPMNITDY